MESRRSVLIVLGAILTLLGVIGTLLSPEQTIQAVVIPTAILASIGMGWLMITKRLEASVARNVAVIVAAALLSVLTEFGQQQADELRAGGNLVAALLLEQHLIVIGMSFSGFAILARR